jgi:N-acetylglucosaminyl-diphospho-decaprenol L-rhamnosyltransferase
MSISAVIPVHNRADLLQKLLASMRLQSVAFDEILVVDNASTDDAAQIAAAAGATVIQMGTNAGFAAAVNRGWKSARGDWVAILNSDVELDPHWLELLLREAAAGSASFATGKILSAQDPTVIDATWDLVGRSGCAWRAGNGQPDRACPGHREDHPHPIAIAPATACIFRRSALEQLNGFDETYGSYLEDVDLGLRCIRQGLTGVYVPAARALHHGSATLGRWHPEVVRLISRNQLRLISRNYDRALFRESLWPILAGQLLWGIVALRHATFRAWLRGKREGLREFRLEAAPCPALRHFLDSSDRAIEKCAKDSYWRIYYRCALPRVGRTDT